MATKRSKYSEADQVALMTQVEGVCPRCGVALFYKKGGKTHKLYELAHIYPLNPTPEEEAILTGEKRLHEDVNHPDNIIPLCGNCHTKFDKPRAVDEYRELYKIKEALIANQKQASIRTSYQLELDITHVIQALYDVDPTSNQAELSYDPKSLSEKLKDSLPTPLKQKIRHNVSDYYQTVRNRLLDLEKENPGVSDLILAQVKSFYLKQKTLSLEQEKIFSNVVAWLEVKTKPKTVEAAEILASFFVQNCEVFE
jgi:hypothetical protein